MIGYNRSRLIGVLFAAWLGQTASAALTNVTFVVFDTETTGLKATDGRILEIGAVKLRNGQIVGRKSWLINPGIPIPMESQRINGITPAMVSNSPPFTVAFREFVAFSEGAVLLAHNAPFDRRFIAAELARHGLIPPENPLLDTLPLYRTWFPGQRHYSLEALTSALIPPLAMAARDGAAGTNDRTIRIHSALGDSECTAALFMKGLSGLREGTTLAELTNAMPGVLSFKSSPSARVRGKK
jgi:DNA polymerase III epsilon subunit-like protein